MFETHEIADQVSKSRAELRVLAGQVLTKINGAQVGPLGGWLIEDVQPVPGPADIETVLDVTVWIGGQMVGIQLMPGSRIETRVSAQF